MKRKALPFLILTLLIIPFSLSAADREDEKVKLGIGGIVSPFRAANLDFYIELEESLISSFTALPFDDKLFLSFDLNPGQLKQVLRGWNRPDSLPADFNRELLTETAERLEEVDLALYMEIPTFLLTREADFYDPSEIRDRIIYELNVMLVDSSRKVVLEESRLKIELTAKKDLSTLKQQAIALTVRKFNNFLKNSSFLKPTYNIVAKSGLFVWIDGGYLDGIKRDEFYSAKRGPALGEESRKSILVRIVKPEFDRSLAIIHYEDHNLPGDRADFKAKESPELLAAAKGRDELKLTKLNKAGLEIQLAGGVLLADLPNVLTGGQLKALPMFSIRGLIPVKALFFRPVVEVDFTFLFEQNSLLAPFIFKAGVMGEFNIYRFGIGGGFLIGAYFSQDSTNNYRIDTFVLQPCLQLSGQINSNVRFFGEFGYKYAHESKFKEAWKIDISGIYITAGIGLLL